MKQIITKTWERIYRNWFNLEKNFSEIQIPEHYNPQKHFAVIVAKGITTDKIVADIKKRFDISIYFNDVKNDRNSEVSDYIIIFHRSIEPDGTPSFWSANALDQMQHKGITLLERILLEVLYFDATRRHLDMYNTTLCCGSRDNVGRVPGIHWNKVDKNLVALEYSPNYYHKSLRVRAIVT